MHGWNQEASSALGSLDAPTKEIAPQSAGPGWDTRLLGAKLGLRTLLASSFVKFCVVGGTGVLVDMALLFVLSDPSMLGLGLTRSKIVAAEVAILSNFALNDAWTFGAVSRARPGIGPRVRRFLRFNAICTVGLLLNVAILNVLFNLFDMNRYLANAVAILSVTGWNYLMNRKLNWATKPAR